MEERDLDIVEEQVGHLGEQRAEGEGVGGAEVHSRQQQREFQVDVLQLEKPQSHIGKGHT